MGVGRHRAVSPRLASDGACRSVLVRPDEALLAVVMVADMADITEVVIVLNSDEAVKAFSRGGNVTVGGEFFKTSHRRR